MERSKYEQERMDRMEGRKDWRQDIEYRNIEAEWEREEMTHEKNLDREERHGN